MIFPPTYELRKWHLTDLQRASWDVTIIQLVELQSNVNY